MSSTQPQGGPFHGYSVSSETVQCATSSTLHGRPDSAGFPNPPAAAVDGYPGVLLEAHPTHSGLRLFLGRPRATGPGMALGGGARDSDKAEEVVRR